MVLPSISNYKEAIALTESFATLTYLTPEKGLFGDVYFSSGNFATVFKMRDSRTGKLHAVKCFTREQERRTESLRQISAYLAALHNPFIVPYTFLNDEIWVNDAEYPVLLMDWVEGVTLGEKVKTLCDARDTEGLHRLSVAFADMALALLAQDWAHGDLKHDNIIVRPDNTLALVDYDGCFVPSMSGQNARENGSPCYRHPKRTAQHFDRHIDDFSMLVIFLSLRALYLCPNWFQKYNNGENMLLSVEDLNMKGASELFQEIRGLNEMVLNSVLVLLDYTLSAKHGSIIELRLLLKETLLVLNKETKLLKYDEIIPINSKLSMVRKGEKYGWINDRLYEVVRCSYLLITQDQAQFLKQGYGIVFKQNYGYGSIDKYGKEIIRCIYDKMILISDNLYQVIKNQKYGYIDKDGNEISPCIYTKIEPFLDGLAKTIIENNYNNKGNSVYVIPLSKGLRFEYNDKKYGYISQFGKEIIPCTYDKIEILSNGLFKVHKNFKYGVWNKLGNEIVPCIFNEIELLSNGLFKVHKNSKYGVWNKLGDEIVPCIYDNLELLENGILKGSKDYKWGLIDINNNVILDFLFDKFEKFVEGFAIVTKNKKFGFIDQNGIQISECIFDSADNFSEGLAKIEMQKKFGFIGINGETVIPLSFNYVKSFSNGFAIAEKKPNLFEKLIKKQWLPYGLIDKSGNFVIPAIYQEIEIVHKAFVKAKINKETIIYFDLIKPKEKAYDQIIQIYERIGRIQIRKGNKFGIIDIDKKEILPCSYDKISKVMSNSLIGCQRNGKYGFINSNGESVIGFKYDEVSDFSNDVSRVKLNSSYGLIDEKDRVVIPLIYENIGHSISEGMVWVKKNNKYGFVDSKNNVIIPFIYENAGDFSYDRAAVKKNGKWGYIDKRGTVKISFQYESANKFQRVFSNYANEHIASDGSIHYLPVDIGEARVTKNGRVHAINVNGYEVDIWSYR